MGISIPIICNIVGAISPNFPFFIFLYFEFSKKQGTRFVVCAVLGEPSLFLQNSAFPWSEIIRNV